MSGTLLAHSLCWWQLKCSKTPLCVLINFFQIFKAIHFLIFKRVKHLPNPPESIFHSLALENIIITIIWQNKQPINQFKKAFLLNKKQKPRLLLFIFHKQPHVLPCPWVHAKTDDETHHLFICFPRGLCYGTTQLEGDYSCTGCRLSLFKCPSLIP